MSSVIERLESLEQSVQQLLKDKERQDAISALCQVASLWFELVSQRRPLFNSNPNATESQQDSNARNNKQKTVSLNTCLNCIVASSVPFIYS